MQPRLDYDTALHAEPMDAWATITVMVAAAVLSVLRFQGADLDPLIADARGLPENAWTLWTSTLLHGGWMHLLFNLYWIFKFGVLLEALFGLRLYALIVLGLGAGSSAVQLALSGPGIGLSGVGYGMFGLLWALDRWHPRCRGVLDKSVAELFAVWFLVCLALTWFDVMPIGNAAHGGGFVLGALLGWTLAARGRARLSRSAVLVGCSVLCVLLVLPPVRHVVNRSQDYSLELFERGYDAFESEEWERAERLYEDLVAREPEWFEAWHNLGVAHDRLGRREEARAAFDRAEELERRRAQAPPEKRPGFSPPASFGGR
jgi:membrane associated rhomboid family serine protease